MKLRNLSIVVVCTFICFGFASAQQSQQCKPREIRFKRGTSAIVFRGRLEPCDNRIYRFRARQGQTIFVKLLPANSNLVFWLQGRKSALLYGIGKGGVTEWSGELPDTDEYEIYVSNPPVMNIEQTHFLPYRLKVRIE